MSDILYAKRVAGLPNPRAADPERQQGGRAAVQFRQWAASAAGDTAKIAFGYGAIAELLHPQ